MSVRAGLGFGLDGPRIAGSLWSVARAQVHDEARRLADGGVGALHWDLTDGVFAGPGGFAPELAAEVSASCGVSAEAHLMVREPLRHLDAWTEFCDIVAVHAEADGWQAAVERIARRGATPAIALSPGTSPIVVGSGEIATLVMSVPPGRGGTAFNDEALATIAALRGRPLLGVDGGVTATHAALARERGATWVISGSDLLAAPDPAAWIDDVRASHGSRG